MKVGDSGHFAFKRILKRHYAETAHKCSINEEKFELIISELKQKYESLKIMDKELDPMLNKATLDMILEGMAQRAKLIFS
jgi:hypothetical protein